MELLATILKFVFFWGVAFIIMKIAYDETLKGK
jgi:hypothetical protein